MAGIAGALADAGKTELATAATTEALEFAQQIEDESSRAQVYADIAVIWATTPSVKGGH